MFGRKRRASSSSMINPQELELKLNLSPPPPPPPTATRRAPPAIAVRPRRVLSTTTSPDQISPPTSCVSSEDNLKNAGSPTEITSMILVGCPRCFMYVMLPECDRRCPKCKSPVLVDFNFRDGDDDNDNNDGAVN